MDAMEALRTRRSCRKFSDKPVDRQLVEQIIDAGHLAASACNDQPWEFVAVTDKDARRKIAGLTEYGKFIANSPVCIAVMSKDVTFFLEDGSAATQNILVAAHALGLGSCWVAGDKKEFAPEICRFLGAPADVRLVALVAVGWPSAAPGVPPKRELKDVLHWEKF